MQSSVRSNLVHSNGVCQMGLSSKLYLLVSFNTRLVLGLVLLRYPVVLKI